MIVNEIFYSIDGEGLRAGELAVFIRLAGCDLRCSYCDTGYALDGNAGTDMDIREIVEEVKGYGCRNVTLTGGEPLIHQGVLELVETLTQNGFQVNIETNGASPIGQFLFPDTIITMDYKCPSSGCEDSMLLEDLGLLRPQDALKFVVGTTQDLERAQEILEKYRPKAMAYLSPVFGRIEPASIVDFMKEHHMERCRLQLQLHKYIWDPEARGV